MTSQRHDAPPRTYTAVRRPLGLRPPRRGHWERNAAIVVGAFLATGLVLFAVSAGRSMTELSTRTTPFTAQDKHYLAVIHNPCAHSEVLDTTRCRSWGHGRWKWPDDHTLVNDAHDVCAVERDAPIDTRIRTGGTFLAARHPDFFDLQVGVQEVAARNVYCPSAVTHPAGQDPRTGGAAPTVDRARGGSGHHGDARAV